MSNEKYVCWEHNIRLVKSSNNKYLLYVNFNNEDKYIINDVCFEIVSLCNGQNRIKDIIKNCVDKYEVSYQEAESNIIELLDFMENEYQLKLIYADFPVHNPVSIEIESFYFPQVATIELTQLCNLRCIHCYGEYGSEVSGKQLSLSDCKKILDDLKNNGIKIVELTGGEITIHPEFETILNYAISCGFDRIALLTNGVKLTEITKSFLLKIKKRFRYKLIYIA